MLSGEPAWCPCYKVPIVSLPDPHLCVLPGEDSNHISDTLDKKIEALQAHRSQVMKTNIEDLSIVEVARSSANFRGIQGRVKYAEAFHSLRLFINI